MSLEQNARLSFAFEKHGIELQNASSLTQETKDLMRDVFVPGQTNIVVVEDPEASPTKAKEPFYPANAVDYYFYSEAQQTHDYWVGLYGVNGGVDSVEKWEQVLRTKVEKGQGFQRLYRVSQFQAIDELNSEGYNIGLIYEEGIEVDREFKEFLGRRLRMSLPEYKRKHLEYQELCDLRDKKLIEQIVRLIEDPVNTPVNIFIPRGTLHGRMLEFIPEEYRSSIIFAFSDIANKLGDNDEENIVGRIILSDMEPTEEEWLAAYSKYLRSPKS